jgi:hypothetical protein
LGSVENLMVHCHSCGGLTAVRAATKRRSVTWSPESCSCCGRDWDFEERWESIDDWLELGLDAQAATDAAGRALRSPSEADEEYRAVSGGASRVRPARDDDVERFRGPVIGFPVSPDDPKQPPPPPSGGN